MTTATDVPTAVTTQVYRVYINAPRERVWQAITDPEWTVRYGYGGRAEYDPRVNPGWHYRGKRVVQFWKAEDRPGTVVRVNARRTYWMSDAPIPGGIAFENFEMEAPFRAGQEFTFGAEVDGGKQAATPAGPRP